LILSVFLFMGCQDKAITHFYDKSIASNPIRCLRLQIVPDNAGYRKILGSLYGFSEACDMTLSVSYKSGIQCNSRFNVATKSTSNFPTSYLKMELRRDLALQYSYYIDLTDKPDRKEIENAWERIIKDLEIVAVPNK